MNFRLIFGSFIFQLMTLNILPLLIEAAIFKVGKNKTIDFTL